MIALFLTLSFAWSQPCYAFPAQYDPFGNTYATYLHYGSPELSSAISPASIWSSAPISATVTYSDTLDTAPIFLTSSLALRGREGVISARQDTPYTMYLCQPDKRPGAIYIPMMAET